MPRFSIFARRVELEFVHHISWCTNMIVLASVPSLRIMSGISARLWFMNVTHSSCVYRPSGRRHAPIFVFMHIVLMQAKYPLVTRTNDED